MLFFFHFTVRCVNTVKCRIVEGEIRCRELATFLDNHKAVKSVWLSEDATAIKSVINYDSKTNQLVGILLPTNDNGCPTPFR